MWTMWAPARRLANEAEYKAAMRKKGEESMADGSPVESVLRIGVERRKRRE